MLGWFGAALTAAMVFSGFIVSVVMLRFEMTAALNRNKVASFLSPNEDIIKEHAKRGGFPANRISEIKAVIDPTTAE